MPSSPVPSHPSVGVTLDSIARLRSYPELKECEIIIMLDGVRAEQEHRRDDYEEYKRRLSWLRLHNVRLMEFPKHSHQATMTREALETVKTSIVYFVEHDTYAFGEILATIHPYHERGRTGNPAAHFPRNPAGTRAPVS